MSLTKDYYTATELAARQQRELQARLVPADPDTASDPRPAEKSRRGGSLAKLANPSRRLLVGAWASSFIHG